VPLLERLAQGLEALARKLRQLVEEEHPVVRERDLPRPRGVAPAREPRGARRVVRRAEGPVAQQRHAGAEGPGDGVHRGDLHGLAEGERRQQRRQRPRQHRLAAAGRAHQQDVVPAGRGDLEGALGVRLAAHVEQVEHLERVAGGEVDHPRAVDERQLRPPAQELAHPAQRLGAAHLDALHDGGLGAVLERHDRPPHAAVAGRQYLGEYSPHRAHAAGEGELAEHDPGVEALGGAVAGGGEGGDGDGEVEAGARLLHVGGREVDRHPPQGKEVPGLLDGRADAGARLAHGDLREADEVEGGQSAGDVDLDLDGVRVEADERAGVGGG
jgi:hypothetical protein